MRGGTATLMPFQISPRTTYDTATSEGNLAHSGTETTAVLFRTPGLATREVSGSRGSRLRRRRLAAPIWYHALEAYPKETTMTEDGRYALPLPERRDRLAAGFANLVRKQGFERLVQAPLLRADEKCFPDEFALTRRGVGRLIRRILAYAGLGHLKVELEVDSAVHVDEAGNEIASAEYVPPAWFEGIEGSVCRFGIDVRIARDPDQLVAILCHEVAHAYREQHGLRTPTRDVEEALTDLTTIYLGFGLLTTNATFRYTTRGETRGGHAITYRNLTRAGYLDPGEMSLLLALYAVARQSSPTQLRKIRAELGATQAELFDEALAWFSGEGREYVEQLALPPRAEWPPELGIEEACVSLAGVDDLPDTPLFDERPLGKDVNKGHRVYRIERRRTWVGLLVGFPFALIAWGLMPFGEVGNTALFLATLFTAGAMGWYIRTYECAGAGCDARLEAEDSHCPLCGGVVVGTVRNRMDRMAREEEDEKSSAEREIRTEAAYGSSSGRRARRFSSASSRASMRVTSSARRTGFCMKESAGKFCPISEAMTLSRVALSTLKPDRMITGMSWVGPSVFSALAKTIPSSS